VAGVAATVAAEVVTVAVVAATTAASSKRRDRPLGDEVEGMGSGKRVLRGGVPGTERRNCLKRN